MLNHQYMWIIQPAVECWFPTKMGQKYGAVSPRKNAGFSWRFDGDIVLAVMMVPDWLQVGGYY